MLGPFATASRRTPIQQVLSVLSRAACASMSTTTTTTTTTTTRYGPMEWAQIFDHDRIFNLYIFEETQHYIALTCAPNTVHCVD